MQALSIIKSRGNPLLMRDGGHNLQLRGYGMAGLAF
jgi:hypothetical protein